jgi:signal transduction histidine kinase
MTHALHHRIIISKALIMSSQRVYAWLWLFLAALFLPPVTQAADTVAPSTDFTNRVILTDDNGDYPLGRHLLILEDPSRTLTLEQANSIDMADRYIKSTKEAPGFGFTGSAYWVRVDIDRQFQKESGWMLEFGYVPMQWIDVYTLHDDGSVQHQRGGGGVPFDKRPYAHHKHVFELSLPAGKVTRLLVRVDSEGSKSIPLRLFRADVFAQASGREVATLSIYAGIIIALFCYNLFIFYSIREVSYLYYLGFLAVFLLTTMSLNGVSQSLFLPDWKGLNLYIIPSSMGGVGMTAALFSMAFLQTAREHPRLHRFVQSVFLWGVIAIFLPLVANYHVSILTSTVLALYFPSVVLTTAAIAVRRGNYAARYFLLAWCLMLIGIILNALRLFGLITTNLLTEYAYLWGSAAEAILLSVALAARMRTMKEATERAQAAQFATQQALLAAQADTVTAQKEALQNKQIALDTVQKYSHRLELEVKERTTALIQMQQKLVNTEKMAALGVFTAGMAHEINNPANFVSVGAQNASAQINEFRSFVRELLADDADGDVSGAFENRFSKLEKSTATVLEGVARIQNVVKHLRATHPEGETGLQPAPVVDTLESAWQVVEPTLRVSVSLHKTLEARPVVSCMIAELNQVFIALLTNAGHALEDAAATRGTGWQARIDLRSRQEDGQLILEVEDNGPGIAAETLDKIFDPFFTTKTVGRGSGLGLSMARDVVQRHGGSLTAISTPGSGALFTIRLPLG